MRAQPRCRLSDEFFFCCVAVCYRRERESEHMRSALIQRLMCVFVSAPLHTLMRYSFSRFSYFFRAHCQSMCGLRLFSFPVDIRGKIKQHVIYRNEKAILCVLRVRCRCVYTEIALPGQCVLIIYRYGMVVGWLCGGLYR